MLQYVSSGVVVGSKVIYKLPMCERLLVSSPPPHQILSIIKINLPQYFSVLVSLCLTFKFLLFLASLDHVTTSRQGGVMA